MGQEELVWGVDGSDLLSPTAFIQRRPTLARLTSEWSECSAILPAVKIAGFYGNLKTEPLSPYVLCICELLQKIHRFSSADGDQGNGK